MMTNQETFANEIQETFAAARRALGEGSGNRLICDGHEHGPAGELSVRVRTKPAGVDQSMTGPVSEVLLTRASSGEVTQHLTKLGYQVAVTDAQVATELGIDLDVWATGRDSIEVGLAGVAGVTAAWSRGGTLSVRDAARAAAALNAWWEDGSPWAPSQTGKVWGEHELAKMHAALEAPTVDDALRAVGASPGEWLSSPEQDDWNRETMAEIRTALDAAPEREDPGAALMLGVGGNDPDPDLDAQSWRVRAAAALDAWWEDAVLGQAETKPHHLRAAAALNACGPPWAPSQTGKVWSEHELAKMHAALEAPTVDDALCAVGAGDERTSPEQDELNRATMAEIRTALDARPVRIVTDLEQYRAVRSLEREDPGAALMLGVEGNDPDAQFVRLAQAVAVRESWYANADAAYEQALALDEPHVPQPLGLSAVIRAEGDLERALNDHEVHWQLAERLGLNGGSVLIDDEDGQREVYTQSSAETPDGRKEIRDELARIASRLGVAAPEVPSTESRGMESRAMEGLAGPECRTARPPLMPPSAGPARPDESRLGPGLNGPGAAGPRR